MYSLEEINQPVSVTLPAGRDLSLSGELLELELMAKPVLTTNAEGKRIADDFSEHEPDWGKLERRCIELLKTTRDLRIAVFYCAALLRAHGFVGLAHGLELVRSMLLATEYRVHPQFELGDTSALLERWHTLAALSAPYKQEGDLLRIVDGVRNVSLGKSKATLCRYIDVLAARNQPVGSDVAALERIRADWKRNSTDECSLITTAIMASLGALSEIEAVIIQQTPEAIVPVGANSHPLQGLVRELKGLLDFLNGPVAQAKTQITPVAFDVSGNPKETETLDVAVAHTLPVSVPGEINTRAEAIRLLQQVADYFRKTEPASPVPYFVDRAVRLVDRDFMALLGELVPDAVPRFQSLAGVEEKREN